jgi:choloylglycine hydrolase
MNARIHPARRSALRLVAALTATLLAVQPVAHACSRVLRAAPDNRVFVGRTQDWTEKANSAFRDLPREIRTTCYLRMAP